MTTLAVLPSTLRELFERIDAAEAGAEHLRRALGFWRDRRRGGVFPSHDVLSEMPEDVVGDVFIFTRQPGENGGWGMLWAGKGARSLMRPRNGRLRDLGDQRIALRLERLFDWVAEAGEPITADFELNGAAVPAVWCEVLAAPLSSDGKAVDAVFGGLVARPEAR